MNPITVILVFFGVVPLLNGLIRGISSKAILSGLLALMETLELIFLTLLSVLIVNKSLFDEGAKLYEWINPKLPPQLKQLFFERDVLAYIFLCPILILFFMVVAGSLLRPFYRGFVGFFQQHLAERVDRLPQFFKRVFGLVWHMPRAVIMLLILGFLLHFTSYFYHQRDLQKWMSSSQAYASLYNLAIKPVLNTNVAKDIPVIINNAFAIDYEIPAPPAGNRVTPGGMAKESGRNVVVIKYFNGVTLDRAVESDGVIDEFARSLVKGKDMGTLSGRDKAYKIYKWVKSNIRYDEEKARNIASDTGKYTSGAKVAFYTKKGICFDYCSLYVAMCRATGVKVSLATGIAYNGVSWGDHSWNKIFDPAMERWINVDPTFGAVSNYFDKKDFYADHKYEEVQQVWG